MDLGRYRLIAELARGGMGIVHLAEARGPGGFGKLVVVKELKPDLTGDPVYRAMFLEEARLAARLSHRHIVQTNEVGCSRGRYFMALELLEGGSLHQIRAKLGPQALPLHASVRVIVAVLDALDHAHDLTDDEGTSLGVVHRDVSPQNVFLTFDGDVKLIDFGVAKSKGRGGSAAVTRVGVVKGSIPYMSPDHVDGSEIDRRADVFAVGVLLREMLLGERLWADADELTMLRRLIAGDLPAFPESPRVPAPLRAIAMRAMSPEREDRFPTAAAMRDELRAWLAESDPKGSLEDLGAWLSRALADERTAFRALVRKSRTEPTTKAHVWLPSTELHTRYSAAPAPPLPPRAKRGRSMAFVRWLGPAAVVVASVAIAAFGFTHRPPAALSPSAERAPRSVESGITVSVDTTAARSAPEPSEALAEAPAETTPLPEPTTTLSQVPAAVLREVVPPNPYDPGE